MKKRKELDALVQGQKLGKRVSNKKTQPRSESKVSAHQLLGNDTESSDLDDFTIINTQRSKGKKSGTSSGLCAASCLPLCLMILVTTLIAALGTILWLHLGLREDLDSIRAHLQKVEAQSKETPEALHDYHIQLKNLEFNATTFADELKKINSEIVIINEAVRLLKTTTASLKDSIAAAPEIKTIPKDFTAITESVVNLGSKITQLESTVKELKTTQTGLKDSAQTLQKGQDELKMNVTSLVLMKEELSSRKETVSPTETSFRDGIMAYVYKEIHHVQESFDELNATVTPKLNNLTEWGNHLGEMNDSLNWAMADLNSLHLFVYSNLSSSLRQVQSESGFQPDVSAQVEQTVIKMLSDALTDKVIDTTEVTNWKQLLRDASKMVVLYVDIVKKLSLNASSSSIPESLKANSFVDEALSDFERLNEMVAELSRNATQHSTFQSSVNQSLTLLRNQINSFSIQLAFLRSGQPTSSSQSSVTTTTKTQTTMTPINSNPPTSKPVLNDDPRKNLKMPINTDRPSRESVLKRALGGF